MLKQNQPNKQTNKQTDTNKQACVDFRRATEIKSLCTLFGELCFQLPEVLMVYIIQCCIIITLFIRCEFFPRMIGIKAFLERFGIIKSFF